MAFRAVDETAAEDARIVAITIVEIASLTRRDAGLALLYISHRMSDIRRIADRIVELGAGRDVGGGTGPDVEAGTDLPVGAAIDSGEGPR